MTCPHCRKPMLEMWGNYRHYFACLHCGHEAPAPKFVYTHKRGILSPAVKVGVVEFQMKGIET